MDQEVMLPIGINSLVEKASCDRYQSSTAATSNVFLR